MIIGAIVVAGNFDCVAFDEMLLEISIVLPLSLEKCVVFDELLLEISKNGVVCCWKCLACLWKTFFGIRGYLVSFIRVVSCWEISFFVKFCDSFVDLRSNLF